MRRVIGVLLFMVAVPAFGQRVRNVITIPIPLSRNYVPPLLPTRPIDENIRVCIELPTFDPSTSAKWNVPLYWSDSTTGASGWGREVDLVVINFSESLTTELPRLVKRLFPRAEVAGSAAKPPCELRLLFSLQSHELGENGQFVGIFVTGTATALAADDTPLTTVNASGRSNRKKGMYWSTHTEARGLGVPALQMMVDHLLDHLVTDANLSAYLKSKADERARPSDLETTVRFDDGVSFFPNGRLDAGEQAKLMFTIRNRGAGPAFGVHLHVAPASKGIGIPADTEIGDIAAGASKDLTIPVSGALDIESAQQKLRVETLEKRGYGGRPIVLELATAQLRKPELEIADISVNGRPTNGGTIEATVRVRNGGPGDTVGVHVAIESAPGVEIVNSKLDIAAIPANTVRDARFLLRLPTTFAGAELPLTVSAEEVRGAQVARTSKTAAWPVELKRPAVEVTYRLFDGNSPESVGDRNGVANNGETLELALIPVNRGTLAAREVSLTIAPRQAGVTLKPETFQVGELPPLSEGAERRVRVVVPRTVGRDMAIDKLPFVISVAQRDFASNEQTIALPFKALRPDVFAQITALGPLVEGAPAAFTLEVRNRGALLAQNVRIEMACDNSALELLDDSGTPVRKLVIDANTIAGQAVTMPVKAYVRRNLAKPATSLQLTVQQADFPSIATQMAFDIQREDAAVVSMTPSISPSPEPPVIHTRGVPATVSFQRYDNGDRVPDVSIGLRFEVQSQTPLDTVRLEQNHRAVDPGTPKRDRTGSVWQYEPVVQLDYGENEFKVTVVTAEGVPSDRAIIINREKPQGKVWVATVGISKYANKAVKNLDYARDDAVAILGYYRQQFGLPDSQVIALLDEQATLANIKRSLGRELVDKATNPDDTVILYFAGHGDRESDRGSIDADGYTKYLLPYDADPSDLFSSALSMDELTKILKRFRPDRLVLIIDSCFSGAAGGRTIFEPNVTGRTAVTDEFLARMASAGTGWVILTASSGTEVAQEGAAWHHGVFTHYVLEALKGDADNDHDGRIDVDELFKYVSSRVAAATHNRQTPMKRAPNLTGTVVVGRKLEP